MVLWFVSNEALLRFDASYEPDFDWRSKG